MILPFSTQMNGKPTYFVEKIWACLLKIDYELYDDYLHPDTFPEQMPWPPSSYKNFTPKLHTIREDKKDRWKVGTKIDFFINVRQKNMFRFAPVLPVVSTQEVFMTYAFNDIIEISIDDRQLFRYELEDFAINDGFDNWQDFFNFFYPKIKANPKELYKGKIIHWTDLRY